MFNRVKFAREASREFRESVKWYDSRAAGLGLKFTDEIDNTIERIKQNPDLYQCVAENIRKIQMNRFPFSIYYQVENDVLVVLRIFHNKRKPLEW